MKSVIWTRAAPGTERGNPFGEPGIVHWQRVVDRQAAPDKIRDFLIRPGMLLQDAAEKILNTKLDDLPSLLSRVEWVTDEDDIAGLNKRVVATVEQRLNAMELKAALLLREKVADSLFAKVAMIGSFADRAKRRLDRSDLERALTDYLLDVSRVGAVDKANLIYQISDPNGDLIRAVQTQDWEAKSPSPDPMVGDALERDLVNRFEVATQQQLFPDNPAPDAFTILGREVSASSYAQVPSPLKRKILLGAARNAALRDNRSDAQTFLALAQSLHGDSSDLPAIARLAETDGNIDEALRVLRDQSDGQCITVFISLLNNHRGPRALLDWWQRQTLDIDTIPAAAINVLFHAHMMVQGLDDAVKLLLGIGDDRVSEEPFIGYLRARGQFALIFPPDVRRAAFHDVPVFLDNFVPMDEQPKYCEKIEAALADFRSALPQIVSLGLHKTADQIRQYIWWCEILHPVFQTAAIELLSAKLRCQAPDVGLVKFALTYANQTDLAFVRKWLTDRAEIGGWTDKELLAAFQLILEDSSKEEHLSFINAYRHRLIALCTETVVISLEVQTLLEIGQPERARERLEAERHILDGEICAHLDRILEAAGSKDPVRPFREAYIASPNTLTLGALVRALQRSQSYEELALYSEKLYALTGQADDLDNAALCYAKLRNDANLLRLIDEHPAILTRRADLISPSGWAYYKGGRVHDAKQTLGKYTDGTRDVPLEMTLAMATGEWDTFPAIANYHLTDGDAPAGELLKSARLLEIIGRGPIEELLEISAARIDGDVGVLIGILSLAETIGIHTKDPRLEVWRRWLQELSLDNQSFRKVTPREYQKLLNQQRAEALQVRALVSSGEVPLTVAMPRLGGSMVSSTLVGLIGNYGKSDSREKAPIPLFGGHRNPEVFSLRGRIVVDISAVLTLAWLGLLKTVVDQCDELVIPGGMLPEVLDGVARLVFPSPGQVAIANDVTRLVSMGAISVLPSERAGAVHIQSPDEDIAELVHLARKDHGLVVQRLTASKSKIRASKQVRTDVWAVIDVLEKAGYIFEIDIKNVEAGLPRITTSTDSAWPDFKTPLFLDASAVSIFHDLGLLETVATRFRRVHISRYQMAQIEAIGTLSLQKKEVYKTANDIASIVRAGVTDKKVRFGAIADHDESELASSTFNLLSDISAADIALIDDRALSKDGFAADKSGHVAKICSTLDVIETLQADGRITNIHREALRRKLREGGALIVPFDAAELTHAITRNETGPSPEFQRLRESLSFTRMAGLPQFPAEITWFAATSKSVKDALFGIWNSSLPLSRKEALSDRLLNMGLDPEQWLYAWHGQPPPGWVEAVSTAFSSGYVMGFELKPENIKAYLDWVERNLISSIRDLSPARYRAILAYVKAFIVEWNDDEEDEDHA